MMPFLVTGWMSIAAIGAGLMMLRAVGALSVLSQCERLALGFVLGVGIIGWLVFFPGLIAFFDKPAFIIILLVLTAGLLFLRSPARPHTSTRLTTLEWVVIFGLALMAAMDFAEALAPAADADTHWPIISKPRGGFSLITRFMPYPGPWTGLPSFYYS